MRRAPRSLRRRRACARGRGDGGGGRSTRRGRPCCAPRSGSSPRSGADRVARRGRRPGGQGPRRREAHRADVARRGGHRAPADGPAPGRARRDPRPLRLRGPAGLPGRCHTTRGVSPRRPEGIPCRDGASGRAPRPTTWTVSSRPAWAGATRVGGGTGRSRPSSGRRADAAGIRGEQGRGPARVRARPTRASPRRWRGAHRHHSRRLGSSLGTRRTLNVRPRPSTSLLGRDLRPGAGPRPRGGGRQRRVPWGAAPDGVRPVPSADASPARRGPRRGRERALCRPPAAGRRRPRRPAPLDARGRASRGSSRTAAGPGAPSASARRGRGSAAGDGDPPAGADGALAAIARGPTTAGS